MQMEPAQVWFLDHNYHEQMFAMFKKALFIGKLPGMFFNYSDPLSIIRRVRSMEGEHKGTYRWVVLNWTKDQTIWPQHPRALSAVRHRVGKVWTDKSMVNTSTFSMLHYCSTVT